jgi:hypothetical protein
MPKYLKVEKLTKSASLPNFIFARQLYKYRIDSLKSIQEDFRIEGVNMSLSGIKKGIKKIGFNPEKKIRQTFMSTRKTWQNNMHKLKSIDIIAQPTGLNGPFLMRPDSICGDLMVTFSLVG